jgi:hypothetical protein
MSTKTKRKTKRKVQQQHRQPKLIDAKDCQYCKTWMDYGSDADNAMLEKISSSDPSWNAKECHRLLKLLYLHQISIEEFKAMFTAAGMDYNYVEHCCGCAGCYESESHKCPDFGMSEEEDEDSTTNTNNHVCKICDPIYCYICGESAEYEGFLNKDEKICMDDEPYVSTIWLCKNHFEISEKQLESAEASDNDVLAKYIGV